MRFGEGLVIETLHDTHDDAYHVDSSLRQTFIQKNVKWDIFPCLDSVIGMLQRKHPGIAISVKTRQAIRTILNNARDVIHELKGGGLLDETEAAKLESVTTN